MLVLMSLNKLCTLPAENIEYCTILLTRKDEANNGIAGFQSVSCNHSWIHCVKNVQVRSFYCPYFLAFRLNTERYFVFVHLFVHVFVHFSRSDYLTSLSFSYSRYYNSYRKVEDGRIFSEQRWENKFFFSRVLF